MAVAVTAAVAAKTAVAVLAANYGVHITSAFAYAKFCVPQDLWDVARSVVTTASPVCSYLLGAMQLTQNNFAVVITTTFATLLTGALKP